MKTIKIAAGRNLRIVNPQGDEIVLGVSNDYNREPETFIYLVSRNRKHTASLRFENAFNRLEYLNVS